MRCCNKDNRDKIFCGIPPLCLDLERRVPSTWTWEGGYPHLDLGRGYPLSAWTWGGGTLPHQSVTNISFILLVLLDTLQLATGLFSQGATAVVHGYSTHALGPILGEFTLSAGGVAHSVHQALPQ